MNKYGKFITSMCLIFLSVFSLNAQKRLPIIDMHMHARTADYYGPPPIPLCAPVATMPLWTQKESWADAFAKLPALCKNPVWSPKTDDEVFRQTIAVMKKYNIVGMLGGQPELVAKWMKDAPGMFIPGLDFRVDKGMPVDEMRALYRRGGFQVLGEVLNPFAGIAPDDERMEPYWALAEELDIPVGIHIGGGTPGEVYLGNDKYRARLQSALTLEEVLVKHPKLRIYIMHAGYPMLDDLLAVLFNYPQVYVDISMMDNVETRAAFYRYLKAIVEAGYGERIMFGSDQMIWAGVIEPAIQAVEQAPFLTKQQKRNIFYNNAARFLRLSKEEIERHQLIQTKTRKRNKTNRTKITKQTNDHIFRQNTFAKKSNALRRGRVVIENDKHLGKAGGGRFLK